MASAKPIYFRGQMAFRKWLEKYHGKKNELFIGFYKKRSGKVGISYQEALDEAL